MSTQSGSAKDLTQVTHNTKVPFKIWGKVTPEDYEDHNDNEVC
jgi:hypothetical protein